MSAPIGYLLSYSGVIRVEHANGEVDVLQQNEVIYADDMLIAGAGSHAVVQLNNGNIIPISPHSQTLMDISTYTDMPFSQNDVVLEKAALENIDINFKTDAGEELSEGGLYMKQDPLERYGSTADINADVINSNTQNSTIQLNNTNDLDERFLFNEENNSPAGDSSEPSVPDDVETPALSAPIVALTTDSGTAGDLITNDGSLTVTGVEKDATVEYSTDGITWNESFTPVEGENTVFVRQTDTAGNSSESSTLTFTLDTVVPEFVAQSFNLMENSTAGTVVGTVAASDAQGSVSYSFSNGTQTSSDEYFAIDPQTGEITLTPAGAVASLLDFESSLISDGLNVRVIDVAGNSTDQTIIINIVDANEAGVGAVTDENDAANTLAENATAGTAVGITALATDPDVTDTVGYSVNDARFNIDSNGVVTVATGASFDAETEGSIDLTVTATSTDGSTSHETFTISVSDVNEAPTAISLDNSSVAENSVGAVIGMLTTTDPDAGDSHTYTVDDIRFEVVGGELKLKDGVSLDHESEPTVQVTITAKDSADLTTTEQFILNVSDVNETPTISAAGAVSTDEDVSYVFTETDFNFTDVDAGDTLQAVRVDTLPIDGKLEYFDGATWVAVTAGEEIGVSDISSGNLRFTPDANESGSDAYSGSGTGDQEADYASFEFSVSDGTLWSTASETMTVDVTPVADAPILSVTSDTPYIPGSDDDLAGYWTFDENGGTTTYNQMDDREGTLMGDTQWVAEGHTNSALAFDGDGDYVSLDQAYTEQLGGSSTLSVWIKTSADGTSIGGNDDGWNRGSIIGNEHNGGESDIQWGWIDDEGHINVSVGNDQGARSTDAINDGEWHHVVMTRDADTGETKIYVDGALNDVVAVPITGLIDVYDLEGFGVTIDSQTTDTNDKNRYFTGTLDDIRIYDRVLSDEEVATISTYENNPQTVDSMFGREGEPIGFAVDAAVTDGSETISKVEIRNVPLGATISDGTHTASGPVVDVTGWDLGNLSFTSGTVHGDSTFIVDIVATSTEPSNGDSATTTESIEFRVSNTDIQTTTVLVGDAGENSWDSVNVYGYGYDDTPPYNGSDLDTAALAATTNKTGAQVDGELSVLGEDDYLINFDNSWRGDRTESLVVDLKTIAVSTTMTLGNMETQTIVIWKAYGADGTFVGEGQVTGNSQLLIDGIGEFQYIVFQAGDVGSNQDRGYYIEEISFDVAEAYELTGTSGNDVIVGSDADEMIDGKEGGDSIDGGAGADTLLGGEGDDTLVFDATDALIDGGAGFDTLLLSGDDTIDFDTLLTDIENIEAIDIQDLGGEDALKHIDPQDIIEMTDDNNLLEIVGDGNVNIGPSWGSATTVTEGTTTYYEYTTTVGTDTVTLRVEDTIIVEQS
jgi:hypothetical protein